MLFRESFQHYVGQDAHFLQAFAECYVHAIKAAERLPDATRERALPVLQKLMVGVEEELDMHTGYAKVRLLCLSS
jgi:thiaminase